MLRDLAKFTGGVPGRIRSERLPVLFVVELYTTRPNIFGSFISLLSLTKLGGQITFLNGTNLGEWPSAQ